MSRSIFQLNAVELPAAEPWRRRAREALKDMLLGKSATIREQGRDARFRILGAAWVTPADCPTSRISSAGSAAGGSPGL